VKGSLVQLRTSLCILSGEVNIVASERVTMECLDQIFKQCDIA
jgi:hypothetical protein